MNSIVDDRNELIDMLSRTDFVVFAGTGVTEGTGNEKWKGLLHNLNEVKPITGLEIDKIDPIHYPELAQMISNNIDGILNDVEFTDLVKKKLRSPNALYTAHELDIVTTSGRVVTTNFDLSFQEAFKRYFEINQTNGKVKIQALPNLDARLVKHEWSLTYLHGSLDGLDRVFRTREYEKYYPSVSGTGDERCLENFVKEIYTTETILFIGFSFDDRYFRVLIDQIYDETKQADISNAKDASYRPRLEGIHHFTLLQRVDFGNNRQFLSNAESYAPDSEEAKKVREIRNAEKLDEDLKRIQIKVCRYENHSDVQRILEEIRKKRTTRLGARVT